MLVPTCPKKLFATGPRKKYVDIVTDTLRASSFDHLEYPCHDKLNWVSSIPREWGQIATFSLKEWEARDEKPPFLPDNRRGYARVTPVALSKDGVPDQRCFRLISTQGKVLEQGEGDSPRTTSEKKQEDASQSKDSSDQHATAQDSTQQSSTLQPQIYVPQHQGKHQLQQLAALSKMQTRVRIEHLLAQIQLKRDMTTSGLLSLRD